MVFLLQYILAWIGSHIPTRRSLVGIFFCDIPFHSLKLSAIMGAGYRKD